MAIGRGPSLLARLPEPPGEGPARPAGRDGRAGGSCGIGRGESKAGGALHVLVSRNRTFMRVRDRRRHPDHHVPGLAAIGRREQCVRRARVPGRSNLPACGRIDELEVVHLRRYAGEHLPGLAEVAARPEVGVRDGNESVPGGAGRPQVLRGARALPHQAPTTVEAGAGRLIAGQYEGIGGRRVAAQEPPAAAGLRRQG